LESSVSGVSPKGRILLANPQPLVFNALNRGAE
jgi:hypothetical protein